MVKELGYRRPSDLVSVQALHDKVLCVLRNGSPLFVWELYLLVDDVLVYLLYVLSVEWCFSREELVSDDAKAPNINLF